MGEGTDFLTISMLHHQSQSKDQLVKWKAFKTLYFKTLMYFSTNTRARQHPETPFLAPKVELSHSSQHSTAHTVLFIASL